MNDLNPWRLPAAPDDALVRRFGSRFAGFDGAYGTYDHDIADLEPGKKFEIKATARLEKKPVTFDLWRDHLQGVRSLGIIPIRRDNTCVWGAIDIDQYDVDFAELKQRIVEEKYPLVACTTKSGGAHLFMFVAEPVPAGLMQVRLREMAANLGWGGSEVFPKQARVDWDGGHYGSWLNLPYFGGTRWSS